MTTLVAGRAEQVAAAVDRLQAAARSGEPCAPVRDLLGEDSDLAYAVQRAVASERLAAGGRVVGHKVGLTSAAVQRQLGVDRPDFGLLFADMYVATGAAVDTGQLLQPKIEAEVAFVLDSDITDPDVTAESVRAAVAYASPALEIVDSRIAAWDITFADTVADNGSAALYVLGADRVALDELDTVAVTMTMTIDGEQVSQGRGVDCLGDPLEALAWLARTAISVGSPLRAGHVVLSGALGPMAAVIPGNHVRADITGLGSVEVRFAGGVAR